MQINAFMKLLTNYSEQTIGLGRLKINGLYKCERMMWKVKQYVRFFNWCSFDKHWLNSIWIFGPNFSFPFAFWLAIMHYVADFSHPYLELK